MYFNFEYDIKIGKDGRPYIEPMNDTDKELNFIEHKFMAIEICRTIVTQTIIACQKNPEKRLLPANEVERLLRMEDDLIRFSDIYAKTIQEEFELLDIADRLINKTFDVSTFDVSVDNYNERDNLNYNGFIYDDKIFKRIEGLKVKVKNSGKIYELVGGIDNEHWTLLN